MFWNKSHLKPGDHIKTNRLFYTHHGIYISDNEVIEYSSSCIRVTTLVKFRNGGNLEVVRYKKALPNRRTIQIARNFLNTANYNLILRNCEHFATFCKTGKWYSDQVASKSLDLLT